MNKILPDKEHKYIVQRRQSASCCVEYSYNRPHTHLHCDCATLPVCRMHTRQHSMTRSSWALFVDCLLNVLSGLQSDCFLPISTTLYFPWELQRCNPWPHVANHRISISQLLSLWRHSHYDIWHSQPPFPLWRHSHCDVILIVTSFATELATPTTTDVRT